MENNIAVILAILIVWACGSNTVSAQINIKFPDINIKKPDVNIKKPDVNIKKPDTKINDTNNNNVTNNKNSRSELIYAPKRATNVPVLLKNSIYVEAISHDEYWKMPNQKYSSWVPKLRFSHYYNNEKSLNYTVEYFNPDGSAWYNEKLDQSSRRAADETVLFESPNPYEVLNSKSTAGTGVYTFKITNQDTKEVLYQGKFKVGKYSRANGTAEKNKAGFYVEHDWLLPFGLLGFHHSLDDVGGMMPEVSFWLKGDINTSDLEGRVFYQGKQVASTKDGDGSGVSDYDERMSDMAPAFAPDKRWKRYQFQWNNLRVDNNGSFNREYYPNAHYTDKNPGEYIVKIYRNGTQIRELSFTVGADGRFVIPAYSNQIPLPFYRIILPVKVLGTEKWDAASWKTEAFYGNPITGFEIK